MALVRAWFQAWNATDLAALLATMHEDVDFRPAVPRGTAISSREQFAAWYRELVGSSTRFEIDVFETAGLDTHRVLVAGSLRTAPDEQDGFGFTAIYRVRAGKIASAEQYLSDTTLMKQLGILQAVLLPDGRTVACAHCRIVIEPQRPIVMVRRREPEADFWHQECFVAAYGDAPSAPDAAAVP